MASILFFTFALCLGIFIVYLLKIKGLFLEEKIAWGAILGISILTFLFFIFGLVFGFSKTRVFELFFFFLVIFAVFFYKYRGLLFREIKSDTDLFVKRFKAKKLRLFLIIFAVALIFFGTLWPKVLFQQGEDIFTIGTAGVWSDWAAHSSYISHFSQSDAISLKHPLYLGEKFSYTFMVDFLSAVLIKLGGGLISSMIIPGFVFSLIFTVLFYYFVFRLTKKETVAALALILFIFGAGLGFIYFFQDIKEIPLSGIIDFLKNSTKEYANLNNHNIHWTSFLNALFLPQRSLTMGMPLGILILTALIMGLEGKNRKLLILAGAIASFLPTIHLHSLLAIGITAFLLIIFFSEKNIKTTLKNLIYFCGPVILLGVWQVLFLFASRGGNFKYKLGWMAQDEGFLEFWGKNLGLFFILLPIVFLTTEKRLKIIYLCFFSLFLVANIFLFQPFDYDNIKIMEYWFLATAVIFAVFLIKLWKKNALGKTAAVIIFLVLTLTASLDILHLYLHPGYLFLSQADIEIAKAIKEKTSADSIFLTSDYHHHLVPMLTGRQIVMGYAGWIWSYGIDYSSRQNDVLSIYNGGNDAKNLLKKYKVDYIFIGPDEKSNLKANELFFEQNYPKIYQSESAKIYKITNQI